MEGAYFGAVAATLGAVRRTVVDQGREALAPQSERDATGDTKWIYEFYTRCRQPGYGTVSRPPYG